MSIDVMKQALAALEYHVEQTRPIHQTSEAIAALRAAIEQAQKPVAWVGPSWMNPDTRTWQNEAFSPGPIEGWTPLYTAPCQSEPNQ